MARVGVLLAGCGVYDGSEIHEAVLTLLALDQADAEVIVMAPEGPQMHVVNHLTGAVETSAGRQVLQESARIARGAVKPIREVPVDRLDALIIPGGFGAAKNLCDFAVKGPDCTVLPEVAALIQGMARAGKPIGAICIAPALLVKALQPLRLNPMVTIGDDPGTASAIAAMGGRHVDCQVTGIVVDEANRLVSTPAYMLANRISEAAAGIEALAREVLSLCG
ncbi:isoprenoid biosynthesis glyoxalase ElbB [bacterium]|nr:isoprenoid biosynthesis glyoxalase ElbB [candidate division CSSED10-310 bacterium]